MNSININEIKKYTNYKIIDIRPKEDYIKGHIPGAINVELTDLLAFPEKYLNKNITYFFYCDEGKTSMKLVNVLKNKYDVFNLNGGYKEYNKL